MPDEYTGAVVDLLSRRKGEMLNMAPVETGGDAQTTSIEYLVPTRGMIGLRNSMLTATRGTAVMDTIFDSYRPYAGKSTSMYVHVAALSCVTYFSAAFTELFDLQESKHIDSSDLLLRPCSAA